MNSSKLFGRSMSLRVVGCAITGVVGMSGCRKAEVTAPPAAPAIVVEVAPVRYSDAAVPVRAPGVLSRKEEADLAFKVGGVVEEVRVRVGDVVKKDQVLACLRLDEIDAQLAQARSALAKAERDLARVEKLQANAVATLENLQDARTAVDVARAQVRIAEFNRRYAVIVAPEDGRILRRTVEPNELVAPGRAVLGFAADGEGWLARVGLADRDVAKVRVGDRAEVVLDARGERRLAGRIGNIAEAADAVTRTTTAEIVIEDAPVEARSGFVVMATIHPQSVARRPVVPAAVLIEGADDKANVFLIDRATKVARRQAVEVEAIEGANAYLRSPLPEAAQLVVRGGEYLRDGMLVEIAAVPAR